MSKEAPDCVINIWVVGSSAHIDRNFKSIHEGQRSHVILKFFFNTSGSISRSSAPGWEKRPLKVVTLINAGKMYTTEIHFDELQVPVHMLREGDLKFIVRGFGIDEGAAVVIRDGHFIMTNSPLEDDVYATPYITKAKHLYLADEKVGDEITIKYQTSPEKYIMTNETPNKTTHDVKPISEDPFGYMEASNLDNPIAITGGFNVRNIR